MLIVLEKHNVFSFTLTLTTLAWPDLCVFFPPLSNSLPLVGCTTQFSSDIGVSTNLGSKRLNLAVGLVQLQIPITSPLVTCASDQPSVNQTFP